MNISLPPDLEKLVSDKVASGRYQSPIEVVSEALRLLEQRDHQKRTRLAQLKEDLMAGIEQIERGEVSDWDVDAMKLEVRKRLANPKR